MKIVTTARKYGPKITAAASMLAFSALSHAQAVSSFDTIMDAVDLSGITVKVVAAAVIVVGIALAFKGPDIAKRVIRKV